MRKIPICSVEELRIILTRYGLFDIGTIEIRDALLDQHTTLNIIDRNEIDRRRNRMSSGCDYFFDMLIECMALEVLPCQFVLYLG